MKLLALHGLRQNSKIFEDQVSRLLPNDESIEVVYVESDYILDNNPNTRTWWTYTFDSQGGETFRNMLFTLSMPSNKKTYYLEDSLQKLIKIWEEDKEFDGIIGFSQGGCMATLLCEHLQRGGIPPKFVLLISGFCDVSRPSINIPSLHLAGNDDMISSARISKLLDIYKNSKIHKHTSGHEVPCQPISRIIVKRFLDSFA